MTKLLRGVVGLVVLAAAGCGGTADLSGTVTYLGKPVVYGTVVVTGPDGISHNGAIRPDGSYSVAGVPTGPVKVAVSSPPPAGVKGAGPKGGRGGDEDRGPPPDEVVNPEVVKAWVKLPEKYGLPDSSGLSFTLKGGPNVQNLELK